MICDRSYPKPASSPATKVHQFPLPNSGHYERLFEMNDSKNQQNADRQNQGKPQQQGQSGEKNPQPNEQGGDKRQQEQESAPKKQDDDKSSSPN